MTQATTQRISFLGPLIMEDIHALVCVNYQGRNCTRQRLATQDNNGCGCSDEYEQCGT
ncbi:hypothetical protein PAXRUDRAFT_834138 [Paxillus rubicundulus Ve08.2h10]|uniref:Uncharacterized protein n=1 Tax=Paxillus rubicundulus Ve08.2h10 TaxID=930991 RepID=A0A0D0DEM4_9AGAM|nr:hypothetical protein PAXRUDRAFT_834138 [Paxillus rubicundulus Ve08.2h10]